MLLFFMHTISDRFNYTPLNRTDGKTRLYTTPDGHKLPSVTTVLDKTKDKTHLIEWRKRVGEQKAAQITKEASGVGNVLQGKGEAGVRSAGHASQLARLGSSRAKKRALIIEDSLEKLATLYLKIIKAYSDTHFVDDQGMTFTVNAMINDASPQVGTDSAKILSVIFLTGLYLLMF